MQENPSENPECLHITPFLFALVALVLAVYGLFFIYSSGYISEDYPVRVNWQRQMVFLGLGLVLGMALLRWDYRKRSWLYLLYGGYGAGLVLLVLVLLTGVRIGGAKRWLALFGLQIQPAEFAKIFTILLVAFILGNVQRWHLALGLTALAAFVPFVLIVVEPSYGNACSFLPAIVVMMMERWAGKRLFCTMVLAFAVFVCVATVGLFWLREQAGKQDFEQQLTMWGKKIGLREYHLRRICGYLDAKGDWNERQSVLTIASGGYFGKGYLQGNMKGEGYLPRTVAPSDFIFDVIAEELGFFYGSLPVLILYAVLILLGLFWAAYAEDRGGRMICLSVSMLIFTHVAVNIGMVTRLIPIIGLPLPLLSYGGSYAVATLLALSAMAGVRLRTGHARPQEQRQDSWTWRFGYLFMLRITPKKHTTPHFDQQEDNHVE